MMDQFIIWNMYGVKYLCLRVGDSSFVESIKRIY